MAKTPEFRTTTPPATRFRARGEQGYSLEVIPLGISFDVDRVRRHSQELWGELAVRVNGHFPAAKTVDGALSIGDLNFSSVQARSTRAKLLHDRCGAEDLDWYGFLEELSVAMLSAERKGQPAMVLADVEAPADDAQAWLLERLPILQTLPMVFFGDGDAMKSYLAMWIAGRLANLGVSVLYADWEFSLRPHRVRFQRLFQPMPRTVHYVRCDRPIRDEIERLQRLVREHHCHYVICDSMMFALDGKADEEQAGIYFRAVRQLGDLGSLHVAHTAKREDSEDKTVFGSIFFSNGARAIWMVHKAVEHPPGEQHIGLFDRKHNTRERLPPIGFRFLFRETATVVEPLEVAAIDELAAKMPVLDRMKRALQNGPLKPKDLAESLGIPVPLVWKVVSRHASVFLKLGLKLGLHTGGTDGLTF